MQRISGNGGCERWNFSGPHFRESMGSAVLGIDDQDIKYQSHKTQGNQSAAGNLNFIFIFDINIVVYKGG